MPMPLPTIAAFLSMVAVQVPPAGAPTAGPPQAFLEREAPVGRAAVDALAFPPLVFDPPDADEHEVLGVPVFHLYDPTLPLVDLDLQIRGGPGHFPRERLAVASALPALLRSGGTRELPPDSIDRRLDLQAIDLSFAGGGGGMSVGLNALTDAFPTGLDLLREILLRPGFDGDAIETWRAQELSWIARREDDAGSLAISELNRLMFGDHPVGWIMSVDDLSPDRLSASELESIHRTVVCRNRIMVGVSGDLTWEGAEPLLRGFLELWPECEEPLPTPPLPNLRREGGTFVLPRSLEQSTVILAGPGGIAQEDSPDFFASRIADHVLGGSGFGSRLLATLRTNEGLAYTAYSVWTASPRHEGIVGVGTATRAEQTLQATRLLVGTLEEMESDPPGPDEIRQAYEELANGYVFAFGSAAQIVARRMAYRAQELSPGWLERYLEGLGEVTPDAVERVVDESLDPAGMTTLIVGDPSRFGPGLEELGPVFRLLPDGSYEPWLTSVSPGAGP